MSERGASRDGRGIESDSGTLRSLLRSNRAAAAEWSSARFVYRFDRLIRSRTSLSLSLSLFLLSFSFCQFASFIGTWSCASFRADDRPTIPDRFSIRYLVSLLARSTRAPISYVRCGTEPDPRSVYTFIAFTCSSTMKHRRGAIERLR